jgi:hypothetical protein
MVLTNIFSYFRVNTAQSSSNWRRPIAVDTNPVIGCTNLIISCKCTSSHRHRWLYRRASFTTHEVQSTNNSNRQTYTKYVSTICFFSSRRSSSHVTFLPFHAPIKRKIRSSTTCDEKEKKKKKPNISFFPLFCSLRLHLHNSLHSIARFAHSMRHTINGNKKKNRN